MTTKQRNILAKIIFGGGFVLSLVMGILNSKARYSEIFYVFGLVCMIGAWFVGEVNEKAPQQRQAIKRFVLRLFHKENK